MESWVLVAVFIWNSAVTIPGYPTKDSCEAARAELVAAITPARDRGTACIPGPRNK